MSLTVYDRIVNYEKTNPKFTFNKDGASKLGQKVLREWQRQGGKTAHLERIESEERWGVSQAWEYPKSFIPDIDKVLLQYVQDVIKKGRKSNLITGKPAPPKQHKKTESVPVLYNDTPSGPFKSKRKRIPITKPRPAFIGNLFKK